MSAGQGVSLIPGFAAFKTLFSPVEQQWWAGGALFPLFTPTRLGICSLHGRGRSFRTDTVESLLHVRAPGSKVCSSRRWRQLGSPQIFTDHAPHCVTHTHTLSL